MIELKSVSKSFGDIAVIKNVDATFETGKCNLIIGASGSGKTVLMKCIVGLMNVSQGEILYDGRNFIALSDQEKKKIREEIGMLFQGSALFDSQTVEQNIMFPLDMFSTDNIKVKRERVKEVLNRVQLAETAAKKFPSEISGGMKKRVALARAMVLNPQYLFCDEPNSGLDPKTSMVIDKLIQEITYEYNMTTIINTHDMNSVMEIGDKIIYMNQGEKEWEGSNKEIIYSKNQKLNDFIFASDFLQDAKLIKKIIETKSIPDDLDASVKEALKKALQ